MGKKSFKTGAVTVLLVMLAVTGAYYASLFRPGVLITAKENLGKDMVSDADFLALIEIHNECFDPEKRTYLYRYLTEVKYPEADQRLRTMIKKRVEEYIEEGHRSKLDYMRETQNVAYATSDGQILGLYNCRTDEDLTRGSMMIFNVCVTEKARGRGIGTSLMKHAISHCQKPGRALTLTVFEDNKPAISLYKKLGFRVIQPEKQPGDDFMMFGKLLMKYMPDAGDQ